MHEERAEIGKLTKRLNQLGEYLDRFLQFEHPDAVQQANEWRAALGGGLPEEGCGADRVIELMGEHLIPNGSQIPKPGCTSFITTGGTSIGLLASLSGAVASPQRLGMTAFNFLEELSLQWMAEMFELPDGMKGVYSSGGSVANLVCLGAARQWAFEGIGVDPAAEGVSVPGRIYASASSHHTIHRAAAVLGLGRRSVVAIPVDSRGRMSVEALRNQLLKDKEKQLLPVAIVANAGSTSTGAIDPLQRIGEIAREFNVWFHVDGAYGLPGILDPVVRPLFKGVELADSVIVDPHKWLGAPVGIGASYVKDRDLLQRAFTQEEADYLEGSCPEDEPIKSSMDSLGIPYSDFGLELSAPSRGAVVWAMLKEIGREGMRARVCRHNAMAKALAELVREHANLELLQEPSLSICCFRYVHENCDDLNVLNRRIHRELIRRGTSLPSTALLDGKLAIRPCFIGARTDWQQVDNLVSQVIDIGRQLSTAVDL